MNTNPDPSVPDRPPLPTRFFHWLFSWRTLRRILLTLAALVTLAALFLAEEGWRGKRAWERFKREWEAKGEHFDLASFQPKPVPAEQNFASTPFLADLSQTKQERAKDQIAAQKGVDENPPEPRLNLTGGVSYMPALGDFEKGTLTDLRKWQQYYRTNSQFASPPQPGDPAADVLFALAKFEPIIKESQAASSRPYAVLPPPSDETLSELMACLGPIKSLSQVLRLRAIANLQAGHGDEALKDIQLSLRLADTLNSQPLMISQLVRIAVLHISATSVWEGLARHQWSGPQLLELQKLLSSADALADYHRTMRGERAFFNQFLERMRRGEVRGQEAKETATRLMPLLPRGWLYQNQLAANRINQERTLAVVDLTQRRVFPNRCPTPENVPELKRITPYNVLVRLLLPAFSKVAAKSGRIQTVLDQATVACALERFRMANGRYPDQLQALVPQFIENVPSDVMNGEPLHYLLAADGHYVLYSVGWDQEDDGGVSVRDMASRGKPGERGDWVWTCPVL